MLAFPKTFITPSAHELPPRVRVLTTTKVLPDAVAPETTLNKIVWSPTPHSQGAALEAAFAQRGRPLSQFLPSPPLWLQQVHGIEIANVHGAADAAAMRQTPPIADAAITCEMNVVLAILTADCLPVVIANHEALAVAHAGWRGLASGMLENTVENITRNKSCAAASLMAWLGPAIGPTAFEVGEEVYAAFDAARDRESAACFISTGVKEKAPEKWHADLYALARLKLQRLGITKISGGNENAWCTYNDAQRFYSWRRERDTGRMATFAFQESKTEISGKPKILI
ncbi:MAG: peptidoglycan editing factor PgeF [Burkholderiales bacterium]|jgi:YfiH family protein|nr:peptidoglycan editing factor PgeF [Burkholderiales bacterium]